MVKLLGRKIIDSLFRTIKNPNWHPEVIEQTSGLREMPSCACRNISAYAGTGNPRKVLDEMRSKYSSDIEARVFDCLKYFSRHEELTDLWLVLGKTLEYHGE
ncbi:hypothetical protein RRG08_027262 [Elysia crispata]|uniref:Uncharacterized protein n=1 Tax=Elysia crispata TaxID=231223 RepID=A0AAE1DKL4_9GAST|nr:hypothetical protein RRG08_027262 [Elysia crispata]